MWKFKPMNQVPVIFVCREFWSDSHSQSQDLHVILQGLICDDLVIWPMWIFLSQHPWFEHVKLKSNWVWTVMFSMSFSKMAKFQGCFGGPDVVQGPWSDSLSKWISNKQAPAKSELATTQWPEMHGLKCDLLSRFPISSNFLPPPLKKKLRSLQNIPWKTPTRKSPPQPEN